MSGDGDGGTTSGPGNGGCSGPGVGGGSGTCAMTAPSHLLSLSAVRPAEFSDTPRRDNTMF